MKLLTTIFLAAAIAAAPAAGAAEKAPAPPSLSSLGAAKGSGGLDFHAAQELLRRNSDAIRAASAEAASRREEAEADRGLSQPKVDLNTMMIWGTKTLDYGTLDLGGMVTSAAASNPALGAAAAKLDPALISAVSNLKIPLKYKTDIDGPRAAIQAEWVLFAGGRIEAKQHASRAAAEGARSSLAHRVNQLDAELARKYFMAKLAAAVRGLRAEALEDAKREASKAQGFEKHGMISRVERMAVEVNRDKARRELLASETSERVAVAELTSLIREKTGKSLTTPMFVLTGALGSLEEWQSRALAGSPLLASYGSLRTQAEQLVKAGKGAYLPTLYAFGQKNLIKHYLTIPEPDWIAGVGITFTLWNGRDRRSALNSARFRLEQAEAGFSEAENQIKTGIEVALLSAEQFREEYFLAKSTVDLARENLAMRKSAFANGVSTANEVWDARTKLTGALIERKAAAYKFTVAWANLCSAAGAMDLFTDALTRADRVIEE